LENQKQSFFKSIIHKYFRLFTLFKKKTKLQLLHCSLFTYCSFVLPIICTALLQRLRTLQEERMYQVPVRDPDELRQRLVTTWLNFSTA